MSVVTSENTRPGNADAVPTSYDVVVVGAGFAGMYMLYKLRSLGLTARVYEAGSGVGGVWFRNRYPGARCDVESMFYSYSFDEALQQEWSWSERYATQPELLRYLNHVADRFDLRRDIQLDTRVTAAHYDEAARAWAVSTDRGDHVRAQHLVMASGCLSERLLPDFPGIESFQGRWYHTCDWPAEGVDFTGQRVGLIGTGSSGIQAGPQIARQAAQLTVFQRTANYSIPARKDPLTDDEVREIKATYADRREMLRHLDVLRASPRKAVDVPRDALLQELEDRWKIGGTGMLGAFNDIMFDEEANRVVADFVRAKIHETVDDPATADLLSPDMSLPFGAKRLCMDMGYYQMFNRDNVRLVDVRSAPIVEVTPSGLRTTEAEYELDALVFATGFDAMTGALLAVDIRGKGGVALKDRWSAGPLTYLGIMTAEFPNLFIITGPGSPSVRSNMVISIEQHVDWLGDLFTFMRERSYRTIEPTPEAESHWVDHVNEVANATLMPRADSWWTGANVPGKPRVFMPYVAGIGVYRDRCDQVAAAGYEGFSFALDPSPRRSENTP